MPHDNRAIDSLPIPPDEEAMLAVNGAATAWTRETTWIVPFRQQASRALLFAVIATLSTAGFNIAATASPIAESRVAHSTGRFDYALPAPLQSTGSTSSIYLIDVAQSVLPAGVPPAQVWKTRLAAELAPSGSRPAGVLTREFELPGAGPAAWMRLTPLRPDLVTLLALRPVPQAGVTLSLEVEGSAGTEPIAERIFTKVAKSWVPGSPDGFSTGTGAFVMRPSQNERASESFVSSGVDLSIQTETIEEPDDGQHSMDPPPGGKVLLRQARRAGGLEGIEQRTRLPDEGAGERLVYHWIFPGRPADGAAPRVRLTASALLPQAEALDATWNTLLASWRLRPIGAL